MSRFGHWRHQVRTAILIPKFLQLQFRLSFLISSVISLFVLVMFFRIQPVIPMFYTLAEPSRWLVPKIWIIFFPVFSFSVTIVHLFLIRLLFHYEKIIPILFGWSTIIVQLFLAFALIRMMILII